MRILWFISCHVIAYAHFSVRIHTRNQHLALTGGFGLGNKGGLGLGG